MNDLKARIDKLLADSLPQEIEKGEAPTITINIQGPTYLVMGGKLNSAQCPSLPQNSTQEAR